VVVDIEAQKRKIKQMLRKAEDPASSEHEREAFTEAAEKMMLRLGIEMAELESVGERKADPIVQVALAWRGSYSIAMIPFVCRVADGFGNLTILQSTFDDMLRVSYVIGHQSDVEQFQQLVSSLHLQVMSALKVWQREHRERRRWFTDMEKYTEIHPRVRISGRHAAARSPQRRGADRLHGGSPRSPVQAARCGRMGVQLPPRPEAGPWWDEDGLLGRAGCRR